MADINIKEIAEKVMKAVKGNPALLEKLTSDPKGLIEKVANIKNLSSGDVSSIVGLVAGGSKDGGGLLGGILGGGGKDGGKDAGKDAGKGEGGGLDIGGIASGLLGGKKKE
ncbi:MAG: hypothetical protein FWG03_03855 [Clostridiales bacterium]|nr:hypothetical protein [Clostridiales bacterium]